MEKIDNRNRVVLTVLWLLTFLIAIFGATFAYFRTINKSDEQIITTGKALSVAVTITGASNVSNIVPTTWDSKDMSKNENNKNISIIPFSVTSNSRINGTYAIDLNTDIEENDLYEGGSAEEIMYKVYKDGKEIVSGNLKEGNFNKEIVRGIISSESDLNDTYKLYIFIDETHVAQDKLQDISFGLTLIGRADQTE